MCSRTVLGLGLPMDLVFFTHPAQFTVFRASCYAVDFQGDANPDGVIDPCSYVRFEQFGSEIRALDTR